MNIFRSGKSTQYIFNMHIRCLWNTKLCITLYTQQSIQQSILTVKIRQGTFFQKGFCTFRICITQTVSMQQVGIKHFRMFPVTRVLQDESESCKTKYNGLEYLSDIHCQLFRYTYSNVCCHKLLWQHTFNCNTIKEWKTISTTSMIESFRLHH